METPWSLAGLQAEQKKDFHINFIIQNYEKRESQLPWDIVALESETVKVLWAQWPRLSINPQMPSWVDSTLCKVKGDCSFVICKDFSFRFLNFV